LDTKIWNSSLSPMFVARLVGNGFLPGPPTAYHAAAAGNEN
jgi:hypothetical protein